MKNRPARASVALGAVVLAVGACASPTVDSADVEQQIAADLAGDFGGTFEASCPGDIRAEAGYGFTCTVLDPSDGTTITVTVTLDDAEGAFSWRVASVSEG